MSDEFQLTKHTSDFRGDHASDVVIACEARADESVGDLVSRLLDHHYEDHLEIRIVKPYHEENDE